MEVKPDEPEVEKTGNEQQDNEPSKEVKDDSFVEKSLTKEYWDNIERDLQQDQQAIAKPSALSGVDV